VIFSKHSHFVPHVLSPWISQQPQSPIWWDAFNWVVWSHNRYSPNTRIFSKRIFFEIPSKPAQNYTRKFVWLNTGRRRPIGCLKSQVIFCKRAIKARGLLRKMKCKDKASYDSISPCSWSHVVKLSVLKTLISTLWCCVYIYICVCFYTLTGLCIYVYICVSILKTHAFTLWCPSQLHICMYPYTCMYLYTYMFVYA